MTIVIIICGIFNLAFALFHIGFWKIFKWDSDLKKLKFANKGIVQILNIQIIYYFITTTVVCFTFGEELIESHLGKLFLLSCSLFWFIRTLQQFIFLRANNLIIHTLTVLFAIGTILFALPLVIR